MCSVPQVTSNKRFRPLQGAAVVALQWGAWGSAGMAAADAALAARLARAGMGMLPPSQGLGALAAALLFAEGEPMIGCSKRVPLKLHGCTEQRTLTTSSSRGIISSGLRECSECALLTPPANQQLPQQACLDELSLG
jgi:hypothetical protein